MAIYTSAKGISIPTDQNLTELLHTTARPALTMTNAAQQQQQHVIFEDELQCRSITLTQLRKTAGQLAAGLNAQFRPTDQSRWAVLLPNSVTIVEAFHAVLWLGGVVCPINHQLLPSEIAHALGVSLPGFIIVYAGILNKIEEAIRILGRSRNKRDYSPKVIIAMAGDNDQSNDVSAYPCLERDFRRSATSNPPPLPVPHYNDTRNRLASIHLSSGTTGLPKGVGLSQYNYIANVYQLWEHDPDRWTAEESVLCVTPMVHLANGTVPFFLGPWVGMRHILMGHYTAEKLGELVQNSRATTVQMLPTVLRGVLDARVIERYDFSSVKRILGGHGGLKESERERLFGRGTGTGTGKWKLLQMYGLTEAAPWVAVQRVTDGGQGAAGVGVGQLLPGIQARLVLENGSDAPRGGPGELWIKGPNVTSGYIDNPDANKAAFPESGWFNTGDICTISSPDNIVSLTGRTKELIKYNSFQVSPNELEVYLGNHPAVRDGAVGPTYDKTRDTELPTAYVVLRGDLKTSSGRMHALKDIHDHVDRQVSGYKRLRGGVWEVTEIPRNATSKVLRKSLRAYTTGLCSLPGGPRDGPQL
ncbi:hypothetical protein BJY01DRAFT_261583 [Aspergillus pseudoustus]|uniref:AMP-dependent synthetase/ligase domain-containing protein n=1 Tax=Aspergillus pseudoustus TaxID=1810923 RepID=A0ABR4KGG0_9EURO